MPSSWRSTTAAWATPGRCDELRLDLAELDPEAADLDLVVDAAMEGDVAPFVEADRVAGAVEDRVAPVRWRTDWR